MKRLLFSRWSQVVFSLALLTQCRPNPSSTPVAPNAQTPPNVEADEKDPVVTPPVETPPVEAVKKIPAVSPPAPRFVQHPALPMKKIGTLTQEVSSLALHPDCRAVAAGAKHWELARLGADGKLAWSTRAARVPCPTGNRCTEFPRAQFLPNDNVVAMMDGDSLRMFNPRGRMLALRGGFLQAVLDFRASPDGKIVGALYPHGLALWRTSGGLIRKQEIQGATAFDFVFTSTSGKKIQVAAARKALQFDLDFSNEKTLHELDGAVIGVSQSLFLTTSRAYDLEKVAQSLPHAPGARALRLLPLKFPHVLAVHSGKYVILHVSGEHTFEEWELTGVLPSADPVTAANAGCVAIASGADVYFVALPASLP